MKIFKTITATVFCVFLAFGCQEEKVTVNEFKPDAKMLQLTLL